MKDVIADLYKTVEELKNRFDDFGYLAGHLVESKIKRAFTVEAQSNALYAPLVAYCVSTLDPLSLNRIRVYHPLLNRPNTKIEDLPFARACTNTGGFDDCGGTWVPPAGSSVVIVCENGDRMMPIYMGTVWRMNRGAQASGFSYPIPEFYKLWAEEENRGLGYLVGKTDGSQDYPPWDIENSNINNFDNETAINDNPDAQQNITYPNAYGWKTPGKHYIKMVDGNYRCNNMWARFEFGSKTGHFFLMKDDWYHPSGQWANPKGACVQTDVCTATGIVDDSSCEQVSALLSLNISGVEDQQGNDVFQPEIGTVGGPTGRCDTSPNPPTQLANPYQKRIDECRPYQGSVLPQNNKCELPQGGIHQQSVAGHVMCMDDAVNQPKEDKIRWYHTYNTGCDDTLKSKYYFKSATGHMMLMDDSEDVSQLRGERNGIRFQSAAGNYFYLIDHTVAGGFGGSQRGLEMGTTSGHVLTMNDNQNEHTPPTREGFIGQDELGRTANLDPNPLSRAKNAFIQLKSGFGLVFRLDDSTSQQETRKQFIMLAAVPKNTGTTTDDVINNRQTSKSCQNQPHVLLMQLDGSNGGFIELSSGGKFVLASRQDSIEAVGTDSCPANKETAIFGSYLMSVKDFLVSKCGTQINIADKYIILGAGQDCNIDQNNANDTATTATSAAETAAAAATTSQQQQQTKGPCIYPFVIAKDPLPCPLFPHIIHWTKWSNRVFGSSS